MPNRDSAAWRAHQLQLLERIREFLLELERAQPSQSAWRQPLLDLRLKTDREIEALRATSEDDPAKSCTTDAI